MKRFLPALFVVPALLAAGCQSHSGNTPVSPPFPGSASAYIAPLSGSVNGQTIDFTLVRAGDQLTGSFEVASGTEMLSGEILGSPTGTQGVDIGFYFHGDYGDYGHFVGQWSDEKLSGSWSQDSKPDQQPVFSHKDAPGSAKLSIQAAAETKKDEQGIDRCEYAFAAPSVDGRPDLNKFIDQHFGLESVSGTRKTVDELKQEFFDTCLPDVKDQLGVEASANPDLMYSDVQTFSVDLNRNNLLSFSISGYSYTGGAHGLPMVDSLNLDVKNGTVLTVGDLFKPDRLQDLQKRIAKKILDTYADALFDDAKTEFQKTLADKTVLSVEAQERLYGTDGSFRLSPSGITFYWNVYDITPYAAGQPEVYFGYNELEDLIKPDGPLASK